MRESRPPHPSSMPASAPSRAARRTPHPRLTLSRLEVEWRSIAGRSESLAVARSWAFLGADLLGSLHSLDQILVATGFRVAPKDATVIDPVRDPVRDPVLDPVRDPGPAAADAADALLWELVGRARTDQLAARVVLQRLLPGLSAVARRQGRCMADHLQAFDDVLAAAWSVIRNFPVERRRRHVAAALLRDCEYHAFRRERRRMLVHDYTANDLLDRAVEPGEVTAEPLFEVLEVIAQAGRHLVDGDAALLGVLLSGKQLRVVAADLAVSERTVRNHRDAIVHRLRAALAA
jgi:DNA-directed RNA polymerase specialized sigma24 family protein